MTRIGLLTIYESSSRIRPILESLCLEGSYSLETLSQFRMVESFSHAVWGLINLSDVIVADITQITTNLSYEIGLAHGMGKPVVLVAEKSSNIPADLAGQHITILNAENLVYENTVFRLETAIRNSLRTRYASGYVGPRGERSRDIVPELEHSLSLDFRSLFTFEGFARSRRFKQWFKEAFLGMSGWEVIESDKNRNDKHRFDMMLWNSLDDHELTALGNPIAVEFKSIRAVNKSQLARILHEARKSGLHSVILATTASNSVNLRKRLAQMRREEGMKAIALDRDDFLQVETPSDMLRVLKHRIREMLYQEGA